MRMERNGVTMQAAAFLLLILICCTWSEAGATDIAADCCLSTKNNRIPQQLLTSFYAQTKAMGCQMSATVFITKKGKKLCAPVPEDSHWVKKLMDKLRKNGSKPSKGKKH